MLKFECSDKQNDICSGAYKAYKIFNKNPMNLKMKKKHKVVSNHFTLDKAMKRKNYELSSCIFF